MMARQREREREQERRVGPRARVSLGTHTPQQASKRNAQYHGHKITENSLSGGKHPVLTLPQSPHEHRGGLRGRGASDTPHAPAKKKRTDMSTSFRGFERLNPEQSQPKSPRPVVVSHGVVHLRNVSSVTSRYVADPAPSFHPSQSTWAHARAAKP